MDINDGKKLTFNVGIIQRYYRADLKPVYFGPKYDSLVLIKLLLLSFCTVHAVGMLYMWIFSVNLDSHSTEWTVSQMAAESLAQDYFQSNQLVIGLLLDMWLLGYNFISFVIYWQFERDEEKTPDDYVMVPSNSGASRRNSRHRDAVATFGNAPFGSNPSAHATAVNSNTMVDPSIGAMYGAADAMSGGNSAINGRPASVPLYTGHEETMVQMKQAVRAKLDNIGEGGLALVTFPDNKCYLAYRPET